MHQGKYIHEGIPSVLRAAVFVELRSNAKFNAVFDLELEAGFWYKQQKMLDRMFGRGETDDPIMFDPGRPPQGHVHSIQANALVKLVQGESFQALGYFRNPVLCA
jgi:hypothetical protein